MPRCHLPAKRLRRRLMPVAIASTFAGVWLVRRVSPERFYTAIYWLMIGVGVVLAKALF